MPRQSREDWDQQIATKYRKRDRQQRPRMKVSGAKVKALQKLIQKQ